MSRQKQSSRHSKKRKLVSCFFGLHGSVCTFFKRIEILEKDCRAIKKRKCGSSCYRAWLFYIFNKRRSLSRVDLLLKLFLLIKDFSTVMCWIPASSKIWPTS